ncbi:tRNA (adenosine(37)-N6)-dimethylallyltransferase MiaA [Dyadobacter tibetensis]|uniref:tRNA (adenosine(37)-N6)-dimethylallyltransferase MiaA n=1 Tax=Dyadobacter tibetensis TaxID=1211851 RepID=UPI000472D00D|nr:tRNA (adenosine(37)-N6)-dimethylallyltransferase MiaA [Dyadobacter tibetensis]
MKTTTEKKTLLIILGPTASGKTRLAVKLAQQLKGEIISADSRQVYRGMDIGTGKDIEEYGLGEAAVPYHLIDILPAGEKYNVSRFVEDVDRIYPQILSRGNLPILCGGTGMYLNTLLRGHQLVNVPVDLQLRGNLLEMSKDSLIKQWLGLPTDLHPNADLSTQKRIVRAIEVVKYLMQLPPEEREFSPRIKYTAKVFGLNPEVSLRRNRISNRLRSRLNDGLVEEVQGLLQNGISAEDLIYYGLEYKYVTMYLRGDIQYTEMVDRLETEIHRFAKRQMTFFRKMEKDGILIDWLPSELTLEGQLSYIVQAYSK